MYGVRPDRDDPAFLSPRWMRAGKDSLLSGLRAQIGSPPEGSAPSSRQPALFAAPLRFWPAFFCGIALVLVSGCTAAVVRPPSPGRLSTGAQATLERPETSRTEPGHSSALDDEVTLWDPCTREEVEQLALEADSDKTKALQAAACHATLVVHAPASSPSRSLNDARAGRRFAEMAAQTFPESGLAHYLVALLTGLEAERNPARGLQSVPVIEREARLAADLNPDIDHGGPDRILGELYLRAPGFPMSLGDSEKSEEHFRRALTHGPEHLVNRLGLAEALMAQEKHGEACRELSTVIAGLVRDDRSAELVKDTLNALGRLCGRFRDD